MKKFNRMILFFATVCFVFGFSTKVDAVTYANFVYDKTMSAQVYDGEGKVTLTIVNNKKEKVYDIVENANDDGGFDKSGTLYLLFKDKSLWYLNWGIQKNTQLNLIAQNVTELTRDDWGNVTGWKKGKKTKKVFSRDGDAIWICRNCGHIVVGKDAPEVCPVCNHPQSFFEIKAENY